MNERIDELLWQAGGYTKIHNPNDSFLDGRYAITQEQLDKFAELIVRDCIDIISPYTIRMNRPGEEFLHPIQEIRKHFGVEE